MVAREVVVFGVAAAAVTNTGFGRNSGQSQTWEAKGAISCRRSCGCVADSAKDREMRCELGWRADADERQMSSRDPASKSLDAGLLGVKRTLCLWRPGHQEKAKHVARGTSLTAQEITSI